METIFEIKDSILIAKLSGEIDHHRTEKIRQDIDETMATYKANNLIFDFSEVTFMDSSGVGMVLGRYKKINQLPGKVVICGEDEYVRRILFMSGVFTLVDYTVSKEHAMEKIEEWEKGESEV